MIKVEPLKSRKTSVLTAPEGYILFLDRNPELEGN
jgi:hypothetical protein